jgi:hypothetical protein
MSAVTEPKSFFRPWLFIVGAFLLLIAAWTSMIYIAGKFSPEPIPVVGSVSAR